MGRSSFLFAFIVVFCLSGCTYSYKNTVPLCYGRLYLEEFENSVVVQKVYLADSAGFRIFLGFRDSEHQVLGAKCWLDSIMIFRVAQRNESIGEWYMSDSVKYRFNELVTGKSP